MLKLWMNINLKCKILFWNSTKKFKLWNNKLRTFEFSQCITKNAIKIHLLKNPHFYKDLLFFRRKKLQSKYKFTKRRSKYWIYNKNCLICNQSILGFRRKFKTTEKYKRADWNRLSFWEPNTKKYRNSMILSTNLLNKTKN